MALEDFFEPFVKVERQSWPDGLGGVTGIWQDGAPFDAGISTENTTEARLAYQSGTKTVYTIVTAKTIKLTHNEHVRRLRDGRIYRITSDCRDMETPDVAEVPFWQVSAEVIAP